MTENQACPEPASDDLYERLAARPDPDDEEPRPDETITLTEERVDPLSTYEALVMSSLMDS